MNRFTTKPFVKTTGNLAGSTRTNYNLTDTAGSSIECNYVRVTGLVGTNGADEVALIEFSALAAVPNQNSLENEDVATVGDLLHLDPRTGSRSVEFNFSDSHRVTELQLTHSGGGNINFALEYGYKKQSGNAIRGGKDALRPDGS